MVIDERGAGSGTRDPRERLEVVLGSARPDPAVQPPGHRSPTGPAGTQEPSAWTSWIEEATGEQPVDGPARSRPLLPEAGSGLAGARRWLPAALRGARFDPGRRGATALVAVALGAAVLVGFLVWGGRPRAEPISALPVVSAVESPSMAAPGPAAVPSPRAPVSIVVSVVGKVVRPGLVTVTEGARVADVLTAAGGAMPGVDLAALNLARRVGDGEQIAVGVPAAPDAVPPPGSAPGPGGGTAGPPATGPVDLNSAGVDQLDGLPGVGPVTAQRIVEWRTRNGRFVRVEQLREIDGIGERRFAQLRGLVRV